MSNQINLKGRWVKALRDAPVSISSWKKGEYMQIDSADGCKLRGGYSIDPDADYCEIMPEGFDPKDQNKYYVRQWPSKTLTMGCDRDGMFHSLEEYNSEGGVRKNATYGSLVGGSYPQSLATPDQISHFKAHGTLTNYKVKSALVPGMWYKTIGENFKVNKYLKYVGIEGINSIIYSERITFDGIHNVFEMNQNTSISKPLESLELVPDEEVAPYLNKIINNFLIY